MVESFSPKCTVVSYVPFLISEEKPGLIPGRFLIPASKGRVPEFLVIEKSMHYVYIDDTRGSLQVRDAPDEVSRSIVEDFCSSQLGISDNGRPALFWVPEAIKDVALFQIKYKDEIKAALDAQLVWFTTICRIADNDWNDHHRHNVVSQFQRDAAVELGWKPSEHEWMDSRKIESSNRCPSCSTLVDPALVVCNNCRCVLRPEEHKKLTYA